jgi:hypothetical protein
MVHQRDLTAEELLEVFGSLPQGSGSAQICAELDALFDEDRVDS